MQETKKTVHCSANADGENHVWPAEKLISRRSFAGSGGALENVLEIVYDLITKPQQVLMRSSSCNSRGAAPPAMAGRTSVSEISETVFP